MKVRSIILAGGEGTRLGVLTAKRTKPAVPFGGKYRIIDFPLSNCVNSNIFDVSIIAQYRPHSLIEHIGSGGPWDLNREFNGGIRIYTPYRSRSSAWFAGTGDAIQQNFSFIKRGSPDLILILSGDHVYAMDYAQMIEFHLDTQADVTISAITVDLSEASRFGILGVDGSNRITSFVEKPAKPPSRLANMGVYLFNLDVLSNALWHDSQRQDSSHDFGKDIMPALLNDGARLFAYPYSGYWVDVGTVGSYWQAHMDLLTTPPTLDLHDPNWKIHTRSEERPPAVLQRGATIEDTLLCNGCQIEKDAQVIRSVISPGVRIESGAEVIDSILLTDVVVKANAKIHRAVLDKRAVAMAGSRVGEILPDGARIAMVGKNSVIPEGTTIEAGGMVGTDVCPADYPTPIVLTGDYLQTRRLPNEL